MSAMSGGQAGYYLGLAREDYYLDGGEPPGIWHGIGSQDLGLTGQVQADQLYNLFDGLSPDGSRSLIQQQHGSGAGHRPGWDLTFSAPKSVSVLWSQASESTRSQIQEAQKEAVTAALDYLEETALFTRRGKRGRDLEKVGMVAALFEHGTSRALDPQLHTHALVLNVATRDDLTTGSVSSLHLFLSKMVAGALYRVELAKQLENRLGLAVERHRSWFEVAGVDSGLIDHFSKRRQAIIEELQSKGMSSAEAAAVAAIETRDSKEAVSRSEQFASWQRDGQAFGWSTSEAESLTEREVPSRNPERERTQAIERATEKISAGSAHFTFREFARTLAEESQGNGHSAARVVAMAREHLLTSPEIIRLGSFEGEHRYTTAGMMALEGQLMADSATLRSNDKHQVSADTMVRIFAQKEELSEEQVRAAWHITHETGAIAIVSGMAGTGKTRMLSTAREAWEAEGLRVVGVGLAARAARQLQDDAAIPSQTISSLLLKLRRQSEEDADFESLVPWTRQYGPDVLEPIRSLANTYGPDILDPLRKLLDKHGPNILEPFQVLAERWGPNVLEPFETFLDRFGPDVGEAWRSFAGFLNSKPDEVRSRQPLDEKTVLVVDEAGMVATPEMAKLAQACAEAGAKLVLIGDERQLQPIGPGAPFAALGNEFGRAELLEIRRQSQAWERKAVKDIAAGKASDALHDYTERGLVSISDTKVEAMQMLVDQWHQDSLPLSQTLILAGTKKEVKELNRLAQERRRASGELGDDILQHNGESFSVGDQVMFTKNSRVRGVENGTRGKVISMNEGDRTITVKLGTGRKATLALDDFADVCLGYATTTHKAQGATVSRAYVLVGGQMQDRELSYVQASRAKESTRFFMAREEAGDEIAKLANEMERTRQKQMATAIAQRVARGPTISP